MGIFEGILLCSDWDGTLYHNKMLNDKDISAIRYFQENGGKFTVCTGRYISFLKEFEDKIKPNTYVVTLNGAFIFDPKTNFPIYKSFTDNYITEIVDEIILNFQISHMTVMYENSASMENYTSADYLHNKEKIKNSNVYKMVIYSKDESNMLKIIDRMKHFNLKDYVLVRSSPLGLEILKEKNQKGYAISKIKNLLNVKTVYAVGDYENDVNMISLADIGYAVNNAPEHVKKYADRITVSVENAPIASIIEDIKKDIFSILP